MVIPGYISVKSAADLLHRGRETILTWCNQLHIPLRRLSYYGQYLTHNDLARLKEYSESQPDLSPKVGSRLADHVSLTGAEALLHRRRETLTAWCEKLGIIVRKIGAYGRYIHRDDIARLEEYSIDQPVWPPNRKVKAKSILLPTTELDRRIAAASRFKRDTGGAEVFEPQIQAYLQ